MKSKLTLSLDSSLIAKARRIAKRRGTSVSALVSDYLASLREDGAELDEDALPPLTRRFLELAKNIPPVPVDWDYRDELTEEREKRFGLHQ
jgi:hypothetical protein